jgi:hypothetical protein
MMMQPGLLAERCPNAEVCGLLNRLSLEEEIELIRVREMEQRYRDENTEWVVN